MDGITIDSGDKPVFLFQKFNGQPPQIVVAATLAMVDFSVGRLTPQLRGLLSVMLEKY